MELDSVVGHELGLAVACCRWRFSGECTEEIHRLAGRQDWPTFLRLIRRHRVQGLVGAAFEKNDVSAPTEIRQAITGDALEIAERNLRSARECMLLLERFTSAGIPLLFVKGLTLSALAYDDPFIKMSSDIDILIDPDCVKPAAEILTTLGYQVVVPAVENRSPALLKWHERHKESAWRNDDSGLVLELHTHLADNARLIPGIGLSSSIQTVTISSGVDLPTLGADELFAYLCIHGGVSSWHRLKWIADLAALLHRAGTDEIDRLYRAALGLGAGRAPAQALLLAKRLFGLQVPSRLDRELKRDPMNRLLEALAMHDLLQTKEPLARPLGTLGMHAAALFLMPGWTFVLSETMRQSRDLVERVRSRRP